MEAPDFLVEDLLDLPNGDDMMSDAFFDTCVAANSTDSSTVTPVDSCNSSFSDLPNRSFPDAGELCLPYEEMAELEWLSNFVEESFSSSDHYLARPGPDGPTPRPDGPVPGKSRSKLSRVAPSDWSTRLLMVAESGKKPGGRGDNPESPSNGEVRRCLHCAAEKTPQWRTGPMGPKTLCNACGVRYKSGRLVPEYRPAASPTFVSARHSNSHRKVLELRRQKDNFQGNHHHQHNPQFYVGERGAGAGDDYMIHHHHHHHMGSDYGQLI